MLSRRGFVESIGAGIIVAAARDSALPADVPLRRAIGSMKPDDPDLLAYRDAVRAMKGLPDSDWQNWIQQANIHQDFCPHKNWYFLPWHRAYLTAFERLCRKLSGRANFALPYWDWTVDQRMPPPFTDGTPDNNVLNHPRPGISPSDTLPSDMIGPDVIARILNSPDYESIGSTRPPGQDNTDARWQRRQGSENELEFNPHDGIHSTLAGDMGQVSVAAQDPIFWLHHCNIDRLWANWNARGHDNSSEPNWKSFRFDNQFRNPDGSNWSVAVGDLSSTEPLGYRYDIQVNTIALNVALINNLTGLRQFQTQSLQPNSGRLVPLRIPSGGTMHFAAAESTYHADPSAPASVAISLGRNLNDVLQIAPAPSSGSDRNVLAFAPQRVMISLVDVTPPKNPKTRVRLFLNLPDLGAKRDQSDPHYVTSFSFFGSEGHAHDGPDTGLTISADATLTLANLARAQRLPTDRVVVDVLPSLPDGEKQAAEITFRRVEIAIV
jgi:tyrosinase